MKIRIISILLVALLAATSLCACSRKTAEKPENDSPAGTVLSETDTALTIVDQSGREVTVKKDTKTIAVCYRVVIRFLLSLDQGDKITGIGKTENFLEELQPSLKNCTDVGKGVADIEALAELKPDLFFHKASDVETLEAVEEIGIPAVGINVETPEDMITALRLMGRVCGEEEKAGKLIGYYNRKLKDAERLTASIGERKTAIIMGTSIGKVADAHMLQGEMIQRAGGINCAADLESAGLWPAAGTEQIFSWDPEYIFITGSESATYTVEDIMKDPAWSELKAVKKKHVYSMPSSADSWEFPGVVSVLGIDYMIHTMYPELMSDQEMEENVDEFYMLSYNRKFERQQLGY